MSAPGEIRFLKYQQRGGSYHWQQVSRSLRHFNAVVSARYQAVLQELGDVAGQMVLDLGGGDGVLSYEIASRGGRACLIDLSIEALRCANQEFARRNKDISASQASVYALPFAAETFQAVVCSDVIEHVQAPQLLLAEAGRVLRPGGRFILTTPLRVTEKPLDSAHVQEFFQEELIEMLKPTFANVQVQAILPLALVDLFGLRLWGGKRLFRTLFNFVTLYLGVNPLSTQAPFRYYSLLIAKAQKR